MVRLTTRRRIGKVSAALGIGAGLAAVALGVGLVLEADSAFGKAWSSVFIVFGLVSVLGAVVASRPIDPGAPAARTSGLLTLVLLGGWAAVVAVVGAVEETWLWGVLMGVPALYLFWTVARLLRAVPRD